MWLFPRFLHQVLVHVFRSRLLELRDGDNEENGKEADVEADVHDRAHSVHPH